jgi:hypothetical protein
MDTKPNEEMIRMGVTFEQMQYYVMRYADPVAQMVAGVDDDFDLLWSRPARDLIKFAKLHGIEVQTRGQ